MKYPIKLCLAVALSCLCAGSWALPAMDVQVDLLLSQSADLKQNLHLTPNQLSLWRKNEAKMRDILDERRHRRERLQDALKQGLGKPNTELRDMAKLYDDEADASLREDRQLRELFLSVNDALDDGQRQSILLALNDQLQRVPDRGCESARDNEPPHARGMGGRRGGGGGGGGGQQPPPPQ